MDKKKIVDKQSNDLIVKKKGLLGNFFGVLFFVMLLFFVVLIMYGLWSAFFGYEECFFTCSDELIYGYSAFVSSISMTLLVSFVLLFAVADYPLTLPVLLGMVFLIAKVLLSHNFVISKRFIHVCGFFCLVLFIFMFLLYFYL